MQKWPAEFLEKMKVELGDEYPTFLESLATTAPVSIRLNPWKNGAAPQDAKRVPWCSTGYYLSERPAFIFDPVFHAGSYYVQEASSMFLESVYRQIVQELPPKNVLDLCAAPGGKSTHLLSMLPPDSLLVSNELIPRRNAILRQNLVKWGVANVFVTQNDPEDFGKLGSFFDVVVVDAPCSGEGLFRRDPDAAQEWSAAAVEHCSLRQTEILRQALAVLKRGGILIYSTCTFEKSEDEAQIQAMIDAGLVENVELDAAFDGIVKTENGLRFYPHRVSGEGFFISAVRKTGNDTHSKRVRKTFLLQHVPKQLEDHFLSPSDFRISLHDERVYAIPVSFVDTFMYLSEMLFIRQAGIFAGTVKGKDFIPSHDIALSVHMRKTGRTVELNKEQALLFLKGEPVKPENPGIGWYLVSYHDLPLGWIKIMEGRVNNYLPKEWRIQKDLPAE
ncbi:MAG TPA: hypothetical protein PLU53_08305 [Bacteroidia bacterium]|nr:hypothetical protein [Bacteroidia bacterium]